MLAEHKLKQLQEILNGSAKEELIWMNGYISGIINGNVQAADTASSAALSKKITIVYGTETGNSKKLATDLASKAKKKSIPVKLASLDQYRVTDLTKEENLFVVISTQGDGEPPVAAQKFYDHIHRNGFRLDNIRYSVLALGDTSYPLFCKTGEDVDAQLQKLGGKRIVPIQKCDLDYESDAALWFEQVLQQLNEPVKDMPAVVKPLQQTGVKVNTKQIYTGKVISSINLNDRGSEKETYHIELEAEGVAYEPGDSIGIVPENQKTVVDAIIGIVGLTNDHRINWKDAEYSLFDFLKTKPNIQYLHERVVKKYAAIVGQEIPDTKIDLIDLLKIYPIKDAAQFEEVLQILPALSPRIYTIASSPSAHEGEIHLTVGKDFFEVNDVKKTGVCSDYLSQLRESACFNFFVQKNKRFKLPAADKDVLMITPGTGIAAFRSFFSERDAVGATGKNWLFFGEDRFETDFLYQTEIQNWYQTGVLSKVNLAFSKDKPYGITVWHRLLEHGKEVYQWIQSGAYVYVCGEKAEMSVEVEKVLLQIIETYSGLSAGATFDYFEELKGSVRYSKDVY
jgi:sulfite reductase (NADPH) flavoprotein alpha-component